MSEFPALSELLRELGRNLDLNHAWWVWRPEAAGRWDWCYRGFNRFEGACWLVCAVVVIVRWSRHRRSCWEWAYAVTFVAFGLTDFREAWEQSLVLVLIKGVILGVLIAFRHQATRVWYPNNRLL